MKIPITQSKSWQQLQRDLGEDSFLATEKGYQFLAILKRTKIGNYLYCPYGPALETKSALSEALTSLKNLAIEKRAIFIRIEPTTYFTREELAKFATKHQLKLQKSTDLNPKETWILDLKGTDDDLRARLPSRLLRYYRTASKKGITIETSHNPEDIRYLLDLQTALAKKKGINTFSEHYLQTELKQPFSTLYLARKTQSSESTNEPRPDEILAAGLVFDDNTTRYNLQGAQSEQGRTLHATGILTVQLILDAKAKSQQFFDFWGIAPDGAPNTHPWAGFTNFKKTFAGYEEKHTGTYDLILSQPRYKLYAIMRTINRKVRK